jgi:hypothetical protein
MTQATASVSWNGSRLIRFLTELSVSNVTLSPKQFADRLGQLVDLADSISISTAHARLQRQVFEPSGASRQAILDEFLRVRRSLMQSVINSCAGQAGPSRIRLPAVMEDLPPDVKTAYAPYLKFYAAHQRDMDPRVQRLQADIRESAAGLSPELAQLCSLDEVIGNTLSLHRRKLFGAVPRLLARRFEQGFDAYQQALSGSRSGHASWPDFHRQFCAEMRGLLLAEIETRLLPVTGLIETINTEVDQKIDE